MFLVMDSKRSCRCCLLRPPDKDLFSAYMGQTEIYAEMFKECFSIQLNECIEDHDNGICEICVGRLQDACDFKAQVQQCQLKLIQITLAEIKDETPTVKSDNVDFHDHVDYDMGMDVSVKQELPDEEYVKLSEVLGLKVKDVTKRNEKEDIVTTKRTDKGRNVTVKPKCTDKGRNVTVKQKLNDKRNNAKDLPVKKTIKLNSSTPKHEKIITTIDRLRLMNNILNNSNATPFFTQDLLGIICIFCKNPTSNLQELRNHIKNQHKGALVEKVFDLTKGRILKLDITDLQCNICSERIDTIDSLMKHLTDEHKVKFKNHIKDCILEFKLTAGDTFDCALCNATFERFKSLVQHMNTHYRNYVCDVCDMGYINKGKLNKHKRTHETGSYACNFCEKTFTNQISKTKHEKYKHTDYTARFATNCPHCDKSFNSYYWKNRHLKEDHNISSVIYKCNSCDKSFVLKSQLTAHVKKVHLLERNKICQHCGRGFYNKQALDNHLIKHEGARIHKCKFCHKAYSRKSVLKEHLRIHANDRRFKCALCGLGFVQKCSMKSHMVSNHGITLADYEKSVREESVTHCSLEEAK